METSLRKLRALVEDRSERGRNLLFRHVCDLFFHGSLPSSEEDRKALSEILEILRPHVDLSVRRELAGHLYSMERPPEPLLRLMITDQPEVAHPILDFANLPIMVIQDCINKADPDVLSRIRRRPDTTAEIRAKIDQVLAPKPIIPEKISVAPILPQYPQQPTTQKPPTERPDKPIPSTSLKEDREEIVPPSKAVVITLPPTSMAADPVIAPDSSPVVSTPLEDTNKPVQRLNTEWLPDLSILRSHTKTIHESRTQQLDVSRSISDWQWETDRAGQLTYLSEGATNAFGRPAANFLGQRFTDIFAQSPNHIASSLHDRLLSWRAFDNIIVETGGLGTTRCWSLSAIPLFDLDTERFNGFRGIASPLPYSASIAPQLWSQKLLKKNDSQTTVTDQSVPADQSITDILQTVSHELKTPLNAILGFSELMELETFGKINPDYKQCLNSIQLAGHQLNEFISEVLEDARLQRDKINVTTKPIAVSQLVRSSISSIESFAARRNIHLQVMEKTLQVIAITDPNIAERCLIRLLRIVVSDGAASGPITIAINTMSDGSTAIDIPVTVLSNNTESSSYPALRKLRLSWIQDLSRAIGATIVEKASHHGEILYQFILPPSDNHKDYTRQGPNDGPFHAR